VEIKTLVTFGDSWPAGAELADNELTFGKIIADYYSAEFFNFAEPGSAIDNMILQLDKYIKTCEINNLLAVFFLTDISRALFWRNRKLDSIHPLDRDSWYTKYMYSNELNHFRANEAVLTLQRMCERYKIKDYYIMGWTKFPLTLSGIDHNKIYEHGTQTCLNMFGSDDSNFIYSKENQYVRPNADHPNQLGHRLIAQNLIAWIEKNEN
jgi:hypothetical protein